MKRIIFILVVGALALMLAACGGGEPEAPPPVSLTVEAADSFEYLPSTLSVPAGAQVTLTLKNSGGLDHNFVVVSESTDPISVTEADALGGINAGTVAGGGEKTFTFSAPAAGTYKYVCTIPGHAAGGMVGTFTTTSQ
jgi:nitrite reductase (NO-forming)